MPHIRVAIPLFVLISQNFPELRYCRLLHNVHVGYVLYRALVNQCTIVDGLSQQSSGHCACTTIKMRMSL